MKKLVLLAVIVVMSFLPALAYAKGGGGGRGGSVSSSSARSFSAPSRSYSSTRSVKSTTATKPKSSFFSSRDDDIECSDLKKSRHSADRIVYKRYC